MDIDETALGPGLADAESDVWGGDEDLVNDGWTQENFTDVFVVVAGPPDGQTAGVWGQGPELGDGGDGLDHLVAADVEHLAEDVQEGVLERLGHLVDALSRAGSGVALEVELLHLADLVAVVQGRQEHVFVAG